jgi:hypothetical protein
MAAMESKLPLSVSQFQPPTLDLDRTVFNGNNKRVRSQTYTPSQISPSFDVEFGEISPSFSSSSKETSPVTGPPLASSPTPSSPTVSSDEQLNERISTLEQVASSALSTLQTFTGRFGYGNSAGALPPYTDPEAQLHFNPNPNYEQ